MMTFKELKKLVKLPLYKEQRVPTVKALEESGVSVVAEKVLENHGSINVYQNGYVIYRAHKRVTVFSLRDCVHYKYDAAEGAGHHIEEAEFDDYEWHIRLVLEGEDRIFMNYEIIQGKWMPSREDREYVPYYGVVPQCCENQTGFGQCGISDGWYRSEVQLYPESTGLYAGAGTYEQPAAGQ